MEVTNSVFSRFYFQGSSHKTISRVFLTRWRTLSMQALIDYSL